MKINYSNKSLEGYDNQSDKPILLEKESSFPYDRLNNPFVFEDLTYFTIKQCIENDGHWNNYDNIKCLGGVRDNGQDCVLSIKGVNLGIIQCKHSEKEYKLSKSKFAQELIKFLLYSIKKPELIYDISNFKYYIFSSSGIKADTNKLIESFNEEIFKEKSLRHWVNKVIKQHSSISDFKNYENISEKLSPLLECINVKQLLVKDFDLLLSKDYNSNLVSTFFSIRAVIDKESFKEILDSSTRTKMSYEGAVKEIDSVSIDLDKISNFFGANEDTHIDREETQNLFNWVLSDLPPNKKRVAILEANAGLGKTVVLKDLSDRLRQNDISVLSVKADKYYAEDRVALEQKLFQKRDVTFEDIVSTITNEDQKLVILIDQLDALSQTLSTQRDYLTTYNRLINDLSQKSNVRIIISVRTFDLNYDSDLRRYRSEEFSIYKLKPLQIPEVKKVLVVFNIKNPSKKLLEILKLPSNLNLFCKLKNKNQQNIDSLKSVNDLHNALWDEIIIKSKNEKLEVKKLLYIISRKMYDFQQITISNQFNDDFHKEIRFLKSEDVINEDKNGIQFFHQTFYDFVFAKQFVENGNKLIDYIAENGQSLYVRQIIKMVVEFLREHDHKKSYSETMNQIIQLDEYRFHIKMLLLTSLSLVARPTGVEKIIFTNLIKEKENYFEVFMSSVVSEGWTLYLIDSGVLTELLITNDENNINLVFRVLMNNISINTDVVIEYLNSLPRELNNKEEFVKRVLTYSENWSNEGMVNTFDKYFIYSSNDRGRHDNFWFYECLTKIAKYQPDYVYDKIRPIIIGVFTVRSYAISLSYDLKKILEKLSKSYPEQTYNFLFSLMTEIVDSSKVDTSNDDCKTELYKSYYFSDLKIKGEVENADDEIFNMLKEYLKMLAKSNQAEFLKLFNIYYNSNSIPILKLCLIGLIENPEQFKSEAIKLIRVIHSKNGLNGWDDEFQWLIRTLIGRSFQYFSNSQKSIVIEIIFSVKHIQEEKVFENDGVKYHILSFWGKKQYLFIRAIPIEEINNNMLLKKKFQEFKRKFGTIKNEILDESRIRSYSVGSPYREKVYSKMSIANWKKSMFKFNDDYKRKRFEDSSKGGRLEHARAFEKEVKERPSFFIDLIKQITRDKDVSNTYVIHGISGLIDSKFENETVRDLIKQVIFYDDLNISDTLRTLWHIEYLVKNEVVDNKIFNFLTDLAINHENPSGVMNLHDPQFDSINTVRGSAVAKVMKCYYNKEFSEQIFSVVEKASKDEQISVRVAVISNLAFLNHLDLEKAFSIFLSMVSSKDIQLLKSSFWSASFYKSKFFNKMMSYFEFIIDNEELHKGGIPLIVSSWLYHDIEESYDLVVKASSKGREALCSIIGTAEKCIYKDGVLNQKSYDLLIDLLKYEDDEAASRYSGFVLRQFKPHNFEKALPFLRKYVNSSHANKEPRYLFNYLTDCSRDYPLECLELMKAAIHFDNANIQERGYFDKEPVQVILSIYSSLNKYFETKRDKLEETLDLFDSLLQNNRLRSYATRAIDSL
ncbi:MAG: AAA family ATPase [Flavobacteriaceae bacterium]